MLNVMSDCTHADVQINSICDMAKILQKSECAIYGASNDQISEYKTAMSEWKNEINIVKSIAILLETVKKQFESTDKITAEIDAPEWLKISAGLVKHRATQVNELFSKIINTNINKSQKKDLRNTHTELNAHMNKLDDLFLSFRHVILFSRGQVTEFRASKKSLLSIVKSANNTNGTGEFEEI